jgi:hypothetical protein
MAEGGRFSFMASAVPSSPLFGLTGWFAVVDRIPVAIARRCWRCAGSPEFRPHRRANRIAAGDVDTAIHLLGRRPTSRRGGVDLAKAA